MSSHARISQRAYDAAKAAIDADDLDALTPQLARGSSPEGGWTALMYAAMTDKAAACERLLAEHGADPNHTNDHRGTALTVAARHGAAASLEVSSPAAATPSRATATTATPSSRPSATTSAPASSS